MSVSRRLKAIYVDTNALERYLTGKIQPVALPIDIEIVRYGFQWETNRPVIIVSHESFDEVPESGLIPQLGMLWEFRKP